MASKKDPGPQFVARLLVRGMVEVPVGGKTLAEANEDAKTLKLADVFPAQGELVDGTMDIVGVSDESAWGKIGL